MPKVKSPVRLKPLPLPDETRGNLGRPDQNQKVTLNLLVPWGWRQEFSLDRGQSMTKLIMRGIELVRKETTEA